MAPMAPSCIRAWQTIGTWDECKKMYKGIKGWEFEPGNPLEYDHGEATSHPIVVWYLLKKKISKYFLYCVLFLSLNYSPSTRLTSRTNVQGFAVSNYN